MRNSYCKKLWPQRDGRRAGAWSPPDVAVWLVELFGALGEEHREALVARSRAIALLSRLATAPGPDLGVLDGTCRDERVVVLGSSSTPCHGMLSTLAVGRGGRVHNPPPRKELESVRHARITIYRIYYNTHILSIKKITLQQTKTTLSGDFLIVFFWLLQC